MEQFVCIEEAKIEGTFAQTESDDLARLSDLQLLMVGGGIGDVQI